MNTCSTCKYWTPPHERTDYGNAVRYRNDEWDDELDDLMRGGQDDKLFGLCRKVVLGDDLSLDEPAPIAVTRDASNYQADLFTQAEFGCVLHEEKT